ncbi:MAG TPA: hypothetical protein VML75_14430 [Kofleriaceae bacterium]|nr:hypothetical protein [Kofleriaceae bacterium]
MWWGVSFAVLGALLCACSDDPWAGVAADPCAPGNARVDGRACVAAVAEISADGEADDWSEIEVVTLDGDCSDPSCSVAPAAVQLARSGAYQGSIAVRGLVTAGGAPAVDRSHRYLMRLEAVPEYPVAWTTEVVLGSDGGTLQVNGREVTAAGGETAFSVAFTPDGFEATIQVELLPYVSGARVTVELQIEGAEGWQRVSPAGAPLALCWDTGDLAKDPCAPR